MLTGAPRIKRERQTIKAMMGIYCAGLHGAGRSLCKPCEELRAYALMRLYKCPYQAKKPTCVKCPIHCYAPPMREKIKAVMRYAGPRLVRSSPLLAALHILDGFRKAPKKGGRR